MEKKKKNKILPVVFIILALIYDASPVDVIPDLTPFIGWADDIAVTLGTIIFAYIKWRSKR